MKTEDIKKLVSGISAQFKLVIASSVGTASSSSSSSEYTVTNGVISFF